MKSLPEDAKKSCRHFASRLREMTSPVALSEASNTVWVLIK